MERPRYLDGPVKDVKAAMLPKAVQRTTELVVADFTAAALNKHPNATTPLWEEARDELSPFANKITQLRRTLVMARSIREMSESVHQPRIAPGFAIIDDPLAGKLLSDLLLARTRNVPQQEVSKIEETIINELGVRRNELPAVSFHRVVESLLTDKLKFESASTERSPLSEKSFDELAAENPGMYVTREDLGVLIVRQEFERITTKRTGLLRRKSEERQEGLREMWVNYGDGSVALVIPNPEVRDADDYMTWTVVELRENPKAPNGVEATMENPQEGFTIEDVVRQAKAGTEIFDAYTRLSPDQRREKRNVFDGVIPSLMLEDYKDPYPLLKQYLQ